MKRPLILVTSSTSEAGGEFPDPSVSVAYDYILALTQAGAMPLCLPVVSDAEGIRVAVARADGVLMTGGGDIEPTLYGAEVSPELRATCEFALPGRDPMELLLIQEIFRQKKPLLAICRGHQLVNVALGGTLVVDIEQEVRGALNHRRMDRRSDVVHEIALQPGSVLADISGKVTLSVNSTHHQAVGGLAGALQLSGASSDGVVESIELRPRFRHWLPFLVAVQYHPERLADRYPEHAALFRAFVQACIRDRCKQKNQSL
jgi:putative glutamine amidotransferase